MKIIVLLRMVPDVVEELEIAPGGRSLDAEFLRMILSESDDHALEQALILKERHGAEVVVMAPEAQDVDEALFTALAKGADRAVKIEGAGENLSTRETAYLLAQVLLGESGLLPADLILTGVQAINDLDGLLAPLIAESLCLPFVGIVTAVHIDAGGQLATVLKEYPGGVRAEFEIDLPAVLGIQAAEKPPRYVPVAKVRTAMKMQALDTAALPGVAADGLPTVETLAMAKPQTTSHAEMLDGAAEVVAGRLCAVLTEKGVL